MGFAQILVADPPWKFNQRKNSGTRFGFGVSDKYPTMSIDDICALPVRDLLADRALVFLWTTYNHMEGAMRVLRAWGALYIGTPFVWRKVSKGGETRGMPGFYTLTSGEPVLLGRKGSPSYKPDHMWKQDLPAEVTRHSEKPETFFSRLDKMYPTLTKVELFARKQRSGWHCWGNEIISSPAVCSSLGTPAPLHIKEDV